MSAVWNSADRPGRSHRLIGVIGLAALLLAAGCGSNTDGALVSESTVADWRLSVGGEPLYLNVAPMQPWYGTVEEMFTGAEAVVLGEVVDVTLDYTRPPGLPVYEEDSMRNGFFTVQVTEVLKGEVGDRVVLRRPAYMQDGEDLRPVSMEGLLPNEVGDQVLWFLRFDPDQALWVQVSLSGLLNVKDGIIATDLAGNSQVAHQLRGDSVEDLLTTLRELGEQQ